MAAFGEKACWAASRALATVKKMAAKRTRARSRILAVMADSWWRRRRRRRRRQRQRRRQRVHAPIRAGDGGDRRRAHAPHLHSLDCRSLSTWSLARWQARARACSTTRRARARLLFSQALAHYSDGDPAASATVSARVRVHLASMSSTQHASEDERASVGALFFSWPLTAPASARACARAMAAN